MAAHGRSSRKLVTILTTLLVGAAVAFGAREAHAQRLPVKDAQAAGEPSAMALVAARELFREAADDVDAGRYEIALGKFKRVAAVKDTAAVRFNIGRCEEQLGKVGTALGDFELAVREAANDPKSADIAKMAQERAAAVRARVPRLTITPPPDASPELVLKLDGERQPAGALGVPLPVDPGHHAIEAEGGSVIFRKEVDLRERQNLTVAIDFGSASSSPTAAKTSSPDTPDTAPAPEGRASSGPSRVPGAVVLALGAALGVTSLVFLLVHNQDASDLDRRIAEVCTGGKCPQSQRDTLDPLQSASRRDQALAIGFGIASAVALGVGAYLFIWPPGAGGRTTKGAAHAQPEALLVATPGGAAVLGQF